jgi:hypothetical protein
VGKAEAGNSLVVTGYRQQGPLHRMQSRPALEGWLLR